MSRNRNYFFTWNNPPDDYGTYLQSLSTKYLVYQLESGASGTRHVQGMCSFSSAKSHSAARKLLPGCHVENTRDVAAAIKYCKKDESRLEGPWEFGTPPAQGKRTDIAAAASAIDSGETLSSVAKQFPSVFIKYHRGLTAYASIVTDARSEPPLVYVFTGPTGTGKTRRAFEESPDAFWKEKGDWWDGYCAHKTVIIDEFANDFPLTYLLRVLDRYPMRVPVKGGFVQLVANKFYITSNIDLDEWYPNALDAHKLALRRRITEHIRFQSI
jgi:hypothetical protein